MSKNSEAREDLERKQKRAAAQKARREAARAERRATGEGIHPGRPFVKFAFSRTLGGELHVGVRSVLEGFFSPMTAKLCVNLLKGLRKLHPENPEKWYHDLDAPNGEHYRVTFADNADKIFVLDSGPETV